jgi:hypothetical protein
LRQSRAEDQARGVDSIKIELQAFSKKHASTMSPCMFAGGDLVVEPDSGSATCYRWRPEELGMEALYKKMAGVMQHESEDHERQWQQRHCMLQGQGFTIPAESAVASLHRRCQMYGRCLCSADTRPFFRMATHFSLAISTFCGVQRGKKVAGGGGKPQERLLVEQVRIVMRIRSQPASETYWLMIAHQFFNAGALPIVMQLRRVGSSALTPDERVKLVERVTVTSNGCKLGQWQSLINRFEELAQDLQWTVSFWRLQDDAAEHEAVCLSEDIVWWKGAEDVGRSAQGPDLPPDDDEHGEVAEAEGHHG